MARLESLRSFHCLNGLLSGSKVSQARISGVKRRDNYSLSPLKRAEEGGPSLLVAVNASVFNVGCLHRVTSNGDIYTEDGGRSGAVSRGSASHPQVGNTVGAGIWTLAVLVSVRPSDIISHPSMHLA